jgi:CheY-like chemotaxis protein
MQNIAAQPALSKAVKILIVEDEQIIAINHLSETLESLGYEGVAKARG